MPPKLTLFLTCLSLSMSACAAREPVPIARPAGVDVATPQPDASISGAPDALAAPAEADEDVAFQLWSTVRRGTLANGLTWYVMPHAMPRGRALVWLAIDAGSVQEDDDQRGLAHVVEHMAFEGTRRFPKTSIVDWFERIGMRFGPDVNASTGFEQTLYQLEVPTDDPAFLGTALDVMRDWAHDIEIDPTSLARERRVVLEEWRKSRSPGERVAEQLRAVLFEGSRYGERNPIGTPETIEQAPQAAIERYYRDWYRPDLMALIIVGDVDPASTIAAIEARFADLQNPEPSRARPGGGVPPVGPARVAVTSDSEVAQAMVTVYDLLPHRPESTPRDYRRALADQLWSALLGERLDELARRPDAPFSGASIAIEGPTRDIDALRRSAAAKPGRVEDTLRSLLTEVARLSRHGFSVGEINRARAGYVRFYEQYDLSWETEQSASFADEITRNFFEHEFMIGPRAEKDQALHHLPLIGREDIDAVARTFEGSGRRSVLISGPESAALPTRERVLEIIAEVAAAEIPPWEEAKDAGELMAKPPAPGAIVSRRTIEAIGVTEWILSNGARVIVKPTDFSADSFSILGTSPGGLATLPDEAALALGDTETILSVGGLGGLDAVALGRWAADKSASAGASISGTTEQVLGSGAKRELETVLQLVHLRMTAPRRDDAAAAVWKENRATQLAASEALPEVRQGRELFRALFDSHPLTRAITPADIRAIDVARALEFHHERFGDATDFTFVIVGDVDLTTLEPLVATWLASLPASGRIEQERDRGLRMAPGVVTRTWKVGKEPKASVTMWFHGEQPWTRDDERDMTVLQQVLDIRLREVLRQDLGGVYGVSVSGELERAPHPSRLFSIAFGCAPAQVDALIAATHAELERVAEHGVSDDVLAKVRQTVIREREVGLRDNGTWLAWLERAFRFGDDPTLILDPSGFIARITNQNVQASARRYLDRSQVFTAIRLPE